MSGIRCIKGRYYARVRYAADQPQVDKVMPHVTTEADARTRSKLIEQVTRELYASGFVPQALRALDELALAKTERDVKVLVDAARAITKDARRAHLAGQVTIRQWGEEYTSGRLSKRYPDDVKAKDWSDDAARLRKYVYPRIGDTPVSMVTVAHAQLVMSRLPEKLTKASRRHVAQVINRLMTLAVWPGQLLPQNPLPRGWMPKIGPRKMFFFVYPSEEALLLRCEAVAALARVFVGVLDREGMRVSELWDAEWWQFDLARGAFSLPKNKSKNPRMWAMAPDVVAVMKRLHDLAKPEPTDKPFARMGEFTEGSRPALARCFRRWLQAAGVDRPELFTTTADTHALRAHDLRATFVTVALANDRTDTWVRDRTGHLTASMVDRYRRGARQWAELKLGTLVSLTEALSEGTLREASSFMRGPGGVAGPGKQGVPKEGLEPSRGVTSADFESGSRDRAPAGTRDSSGDPGGHRSSRRLSLSLPSAPVAPAPRRSPSSEGSIVALDHHALDAFALDVFATPRGFMSAVRMAAWAAWGSP